MDENGAERRQAASACSKPLLSVGQAWTSQRGQNTDRKRNATKVRCMEAHKCNGTTCAARHTMCRRLLGGVRLYDKYFAADSERGPRGLNDNMQKVAAATFLEEER